MRKLRWGILGVAGILERLLPAFVRARRVELCAIASRSLAKAQSAAKTWGIAKAYGDYQILLDDDDIDAVYVPLPNSLHAEWTRRAADRGKHVLCEKPLTATAPECQALVAYCRDKNVKLMDGFMWPHHPRTAKIKEFLASGKLGRVERVTGAFTFQLPMDPGSIGLQPDMAGGSLLDVGCYPVYGIRWAFGGEPVRVWATAQYRFGVDVSLAAILWFADGRAASLDCGFTQPFRQWLEIVGEKGTVTVPDMWLPRKASYIIQYDESLSAEEFIVPGFDQIECMLENFTNYVLDDKPVLPGPEEAIQNARVIDALLKSAREGKMAKVV